jgi:hypothetical protein
VTITLVRHPRPRLRQLKRPPYTLHDHVRVSGRAPSGRAHPHTDGASPGSFHLHRVHELWRGSRDGLAVAAAACGEPRPPRGLRSGTPRPVGAHGHVAARRGASCLRAPHLFFFEPERKESVRPTRELDLRALVDGPAPPALAASSTSASDCCSDVIDEAGDAPPPSGLAGVIEPIAERWRVAEEEGATVSRSRADGSPKTCAARKMRSRTPLGAVRCHESGAFLPCGTVSVKPSVLAGSSTILTFA